MRLEKPNTDETADDTFSETERQNPSRGQAILNTLAGLDDPAGVREFAGWLFCEDPVLRSQAIDTMRLLDAEGARVLDALLGNRDPEVRIFAVDILDASRHPDAERWLVEVLERDLQANVCATAVELLCEVGTEASIDPLLHVKARFPRNLFIQFAADLALKRILET
jgi:HEAT repeat protein